MASSELFQHEAYLSAKSLGSGATNVESNSCRFRGLGGESGFTLLFEGHDRAVTCQAMPVKTVAAYVGEHDTFITAHLHQLRRADS